MSVSAYQKISLPELTLFLDDIYRNITHDDNTDFKKLILYLYGFTSSKLQVLQQKDDVNFNENIGLLKRLISTIELVLTKRKHLLNVEITSEEDAQIFSLDTSNKFQNDPQLLYEWAIFFGLKHIVAFNDSNEITNIVKSYIIDIINLVTTNLHNFRYKNQIKLKLLKIFDDDLNKLFNSLSIANSLLNFNSTYSKDLARTIHLFSILNDYDLSVKLLLNINSMELKFESYARKLWFILSLIDLKLIVVNESDSNLRLLDNLKSVLALNLTNNLVINESVNWSQISLVINWIIDHIKSFDDNTSNTYNLQLVALNRSISYSLIRVFQLCREKDCLESFINSFQLNSFIISISNKHTNFPEIIIKSLHLINYQYGITTNNLKIINFYRSNKFVITPFNDFELDSLKLELNEYSYKLSHENKIICNLLDFIVIPKSMIYDNDNNDQFNFGSWINHIKLLIDKDLRDPNRDTRIFDNRSALYTLITSLGHFPCLVSGDYHFKVEECTRCGNCPMNKTYYETVSSLRKYVTDQQDMQVYYKNIICDFLLGDKIKVIQNDPLLCSNMLLTIFKLFVSFKPPTKYNYNEDVIFRFVMRCLSQSLNRDVRILATRILPLYLISPKDEVLETSFRSMFREISQIKFDNDSRKIYLAESTIKALGELAIISEGEWLCVLFIKLIDLFGEANEQHVNLVYSEFLNVAAAKCLTPYKLLSPFLPSIAERIVKQPRMLQKITELLGVSKKYFLNRTKEYTTPRFLEYYKHDFIHEIAEASGMSKWKLITRHLPRIMATYLCKDDTINESYIINVLSNVSPEYKTLSMTDLISSVGEITWFILLQIQIEEKGNFQNEGKILNALRYVSKINLLKNGSNKKTIPKDFDYIENLLGDHVLELVQRFSENVHHIKGTKPYLEKVSSLRAIEFLISNNTAAAASALGQISTCLQATLENPDFELPAIRCWNVLVQNLQTNHLISLFDIIISLIFQKFNKLEHRSKLIAVDILKKLFLELRDKYNKYSLYYFSVPFIENLDKYYKLDASFRNLMKPKSKISYFPEFTRRLKTSNKYVVQQALDDLINYTTKYQERCQNEDFKDPLLEDYISELMRTLLDTASKFKNGNNEISTSCAKSLAIIGALDSNKFNLKTIKDQVIIIHDFHDYKENADFLRHFMENRVIKLFWASNDPIKQLFSAYSMQKFLEVLRLDSSVLNPTSQDLLAETWKNFSDVAKSTLTPLLSSKYVSPISRFERLQFPYYKVGSNHEKWLIEFTSNLLKRPLKSVLETPNETKYVIFQTCSMLARNQDISICQYILKYVALSHIINGDESVASDIKAEFLHILHIDSTSLPPDRVEQLKLCYQSIFEVLDYCNEWVSAATQYLNDSQLLKAETIRLKKNIAFVGIFLESIPMDLIAIKSAECDSYERTILYLEKCYRDGRVDESYLIDNLNIVSTLQSMYSNINDFDALAGILKKFSTNNLTEKLTTFQYNENWALAQESFQVLSETGNEENKIKNNTKLLKSLSDHALYDEVLSTLAAKIDLDNLSSIPLDWSMVGLQAAVVSGDKNQIDKWTYITDSIGKPQDVETLTNYQFAKGLKFLYESKNEDFNQYMESIYRTIGTSLVSSMSSSFSRNSVLMAQLHIMFDLSLIVSNYSLLNESLRRENEIILKERIKNIDQSFDSQWKILAMHRVAYMIIQDKNKISDILLFCSKVARKNERLDISTRSIMNAMALNDKGANIEYAELLWAQGRQTEAIKSLAKIISDDQFKSKQQKASVQLQYAEWLDESNHSSSATIISEYVKAYKLESTWEKPFYDLGKYYNKIKESQSDISGFCEQQIIRFFLKALALGPTFIFEALPKFITVWLDFAQQQKKSKESERIMNQIILDISSYIDVIPVYVWYTSITQILSRIGHKHNPSAQLLFQIIFKLVQAYPKHSLWYVLSHLNSNDSTRKQRVSGILKKLQSSDTSLASNVQSARELFGSLIKLAGFKILKKTIRRMSIKNDFGINNLNESYNSLVIPVRSNLEIRLPSVKHTKNFASAFPKSSSVTFEGFDDMVNIFHSLQMPRQVFIRGSNGLTYLLMVKKDDTRKDAKVVEFTTMINRLLSASTEARKRNLSIANYSVVPLAENMGVIEFVQDVATMKGIINDQRKRMGQLSNDRKLFMKLDEAQKMVKSKTSSDQSALSNLIELFESICKATPPVLHNWFINQFSDPRTWYLARTSFTRSSAVMSIVGYIIGLGDRHCENILFFKRTGSVLHIDFDCLFEKGKTLPTPEIVPFRLTQNMVDAMGISGIEGSFRITCEVTGSILRENEASLMNILETLIYDPLLDWKTQQNPQDHLRKVRRKIRGLVDENEGLPMNIHGQVDILIQEASAVEKLCQMYGGWAAYT